MSGTITPEERSRRYKEYTKRQREENKKKEYIKRLVFGSDKHDRRTCNCDGCMWWWRLNIVITKEGQFMEVLPSIKILIEEKGIDLYMRDLILQLKNVDNLGRPPLWVAYNEATNRKLVYNEV